jgi:hypothetical protein
MMSPTFLQLYVNNPMSVHIDLEVRETAIRMLVDIFFGVRAGVATTIKVGD